MVSSELVELHKNDLPGYNLVGYKEVAIPYYQLNLKFLYTEQKTLSTIQEFTLNLSYQGLNEEQISDLIAIDYDAIHAAMLSLYQIDFISPITYQVTSDGLNYIKNNSIDSLETGQFTIMMDSITEKIDINLNQYIFAKTAKEENLFCIRGFIPKPTIDSLNFQKIKKAFNKYIAKEEVDIKGDLLEIVNVGYKPSKFKRIIVFLYQNNADEIRIQTFDRNYKIEGYEPVFFEIDKSGEDIAPYDVGNYFSSPFVQQIDSYILSLDQTSQTISEDRYYNYLEKSGDCTVILPLIDQDDCSELFLNIIKNKIKKGHLIHLIISGQEYLNNYQFELINEIMLLQHTAPSNLFVTQVKEFLPSIVSSQGQGFIRILTKHDLALSTTKLGITEQLIILTETDLIKLKELIPQIESFKEISFTFPPIDATWVRTKMPVLKGLLFKFDEILKTKYSFGFLQQNGLPNDHDFLNIPLANSKSKCQVFLNSFNQAIYEPFISNSKAFHDPKFYWITFKRDYPNLQRIIDKTRVYRNKCTHFKLDINNQRLYDEYIDEDFNGFMPEIVRNGFIYMQYLIISQLESELRQIIQLQS